MLKSFEIRGFRTFQELKIESLGQVNLIVGKNNVGKTTLLEALRLYAAGGSASELELLLRERDEVLLQAEPDGSEYRIQSLFHGWSPDLFENNEIQLGPIDQPNERVLIRLVPLVRVERPDASYSFRFEEVNEIVDGVDWEPGFSIEFRNKPMSRIPVSSIGRRISSRRLNPPMRPPFVPAKGVSEEEAVQWWDAVSLHEGEKRIYECLSHFANVTGINAVGDPRGRDRRMFLVKLANAPFPVPIRSLGHGMERMFHISLAAEQTHGTEAFEKGSGVFDDSSDSNRIPFLFIDEFENGIYHGVLCDLWRFVFRLAKLNHLQVFATTHSGDCVAAFLRVSEEDREIDGKLIRIEGRDDKRRAKHFDESEFSIIRESKIEVR